MLQRERVCTYIPSPLRGYLPISWLVMAENEIMDTQNINDPIDQYADLVDFKTGKVIKSAYGKNIFRDSCTGKRQSRPNAINLTFLEEEPYGTEREHAWAWLVLFQGSSSNKIFGFLAFSLELLDRFVPDFDRIIKKV